MSKKRKNRKNKNKARKQAYVYYTDSPEQIKTIALQVFGSTYFSLSSLNDK